MSWETDGEISFQSEGRLLQELGERLVATHEVALLELIKNSYDADSPDCNVRLIDDGQGLLVEDHGHGMSLEDFQERWMRIATSNKLDRRVSKIFQRPLTGQKGIGRFAVRFLGEVLNLETVTRDEKRGFKTRLSVSFDWREVDKARSLSEAKFLYHVEEVEDSTPVGTRLSIYNLKESHEFYNSSRFRAKVLKLTSPISGLERGRFVHNRGRAKEDPGFKVELPKSDVDDNTGFDLAGNVLNQAWARLIIDSHGGSTSYVVTFFDGRVNKLENLRYSSGISKGLFADIRFFPRRAGVFSAKGIDGRDAWAWVRENSGVAVVDHGFRVKPFGFHDDDWLFLDADNAHSSRDWRTEIAKTHFPIPDEIKGTPRLTPALYLPTNFQVVGAVFVQSQMSKNKQLDDGLDLMPSMDREGYLKNKAFIDLVEIVRGGIEFLANVDKQFVLDKEEQEAKVLAQQTRSDLKEAIEYIQASPTLIKEDKIRLVKDYSQLVEKLKEVETYDRVARQKLEIMSALGVVAGFMSHESSKIVEALGTSIHTLKKLSKTNPSILNHLEELDESYTHFKGHVEYTRLFTNSVQNLNFSKFKAKPQIDLVIDKFGSFASARGIVIENEVDNGVFVPEMPTPLYSGIVLNLFTNAIKAILAQEFRGKRQRIVFRSWNEPKKHFVEVLDTGVGIPPGMRSRVFDPLFTTTSRLNNPLGTGMGLGLSLIKQLLEQIKGKIEIINAPPGFSTCFRVELRGDI
jgi:signal transduction histidine kinase